MFETKCVDDNFRMLVTDLNVYHIQYMFDLIHLKITNITVADSGVFFSKVIDILEILIGGERISKRKNNGK